MEVGGELGGNDHLVSDAAFLHPLANPFLRLFELIVVGSVDKISTLRTKEVQDAFGSLLVTSSHCRGLSTIFDALQRLNGVF